MKTEAEIRRYRDALHTLPKIPCGCAARGHAAECQKALEFSALFVDALDWVLGSNELYQSVVDRTAEGTDRFLAGPGAG